MSKLGVIGKAILDNFPYGFFSLDQLLRLTKISRKYVTDVLVVFSEEGLIKKIAKQRKEHIPGHSPRFSLTYTANRKALAARIAPRLKEDTVQDRIWKVIRGKRQFNLRDLIVVAGVKRGMARWYLKALRTIGIIQPSRTGGGLGVEWRLVKDVGVRRPYIETNRKAKNRGMNSKGIPEVNIGKRDRRINIWLSKADVESVKKEALKLNLSSSAYLRMLMYKHLGFDEKIARAKACRRSF
jgi:ribosomal protein S25